MGSYLRRIEKLEAEHTAVSHMPLRFLVQFVNAHREAVTVFADGQWFHRFDGESEDELRQRARHAVGWDD